MGLPSEVGKQRIKSQSHSFHPTPPMSLLTSGDQGFPGVSLRDLPPTPPLLSPTHGFALNRISGTLLEGHHYNDRLAKDLWKRRCSFGEEA